MATTNKKTYYAFRIINCKVPHWKKGKISREEENILVASFDVDLCDKERNDWGVFRDRRTDLYGDLLKLSAVKK